MRLRPCESKDPLESPFQPARRSFPPHFNANSRGEQATLKAQVAELYKAQNTHLQTIKSLETGLSSVQQAERQLKQEYATATAANFLTGLTIRLATLRERRNDLELRAVLHNEALREKNQQIQVHQFSSNS